METATTLIFVRHGQTIWNSEGRWQGWQDSPLTPVGIEQAESVARDLQNTQINKVYCSNTGRAIETAVIIARSHGLTPEPTDALRERNYGDYEGLNSKEIEVKLPGSRFRATRDTRENWRPPGGETMAEVRERVRAFLEQIVPAYRGKTVLNVTHSGVVRAMDSICQNKPFDEIWSRVPPNCCIFMVKAFGDGRWEILQDFHKDLQHA